MPNFEKIKADTQKVYTQKAKFWHKVRNRSGYENTWLDRFAEHLPKPADILDLGCGTGDPIAAYFLASGYSITGVDYAASMINIARETLPEGRWVLADMIELPDLGMFDGILSWDGFFHLSISEQRAALPRYAKLIKPGGVLLMTVGIGEGEVTGHIDDKTVYHASLSPVEYKEILKNAGFENVTYHPEDPDGFGRNILLATGLRQN